MFKSRKTLVLYDYEELGNHPLESALGVVPFALRAWKTEFENTGWYLDQVSFFHRSVPGPQYSDSAQTSEMWEKYDPSVGDWFSLNDTPGNLNYSYLNRTIKVLVVEGETHLMALAGPAKGTVYAGWKWSVSWHGKNPNRPERANYSFVGTLNPTESISDDFKTIVGGELGVTPTNAKDLMRRQP